MNYKLIGASGHSRVILIFLGWGMDASPFMDLKRPGYDIILIWDYRRLGIDWSIVSGYEEICIISWSMGVFAAALTTQAIENRVTLRLAVNGTVTPVHDHEGIPEKIFYGTLNSLDERNLVKFYRRMFTSRDDWEKFKTTLPSRDIEELKEELQAVATATVFSAEPVMRCDVVLVSEEDRIFPPTNVWRAWSPVVEGSSKTALERSKESTPRIRAMSGGHYPDFQKILDRYVIDKETSAQKFARAGKDYKVNAVAQADVRERLVKELCRIIADDSKLSVKTNLLEIGAGVEDFSEFFTRFCHPQSHKTYWDLNLESSESPLEHKKCCDAEIEAGKQQQRIYDLILSSSTIQWFNSPEKFLSRLAGLITNDGIVAISTYVKDNMQEVAYATGTGLQLPTLMEWYRMAKKYFDVTVAYEYRYELKFPLAIDVFRHLSLTGVNGLGGNDASSKLRHALACYPPRLDGKYYLTYRPAILILKGTGNNQNKQQ